MEVCTLKKFKEVKVLTPTRFEDNRGFFSEIYNKEKFFDLGIDLDFVQDNQSLSTEIYTLRGLHFQSPPFAQDKLVRVLNGSILDVAVDIRKNSPTYGDYISVELSSEKFNQILVPKGFAHAILTLEKNTEIIYKVTNYYSKENDHGIAWNDKELNIDWGISEDKVIVSEKDNNQPKFNSLEDYF